MQPESEGSIYTYYINGNDVLITSSLLEDFCAICENKNCEQCNVTPCG